MSITDDVANGLTGTLNSWSLTVQPPSTNTYIAQLGRVATIPDPTGTVTQPFDSTIFVPDSFPVEGVSVQLNITHANDPDLEAYLIAPDGTTVQLFKNVGSTGTHANFTNTVFDDNATTSILAGGAPFFGSFKPQQAGGFRPGAGLRPHRRCRSTPTAPGRCGSSTIRPTASPARSIAGR